MIEVQRIRDAYRRQLHQLVSASLSSPLSPQRQVKEMHQDGKRVKLDVDVRTPEIVVPVSSQSAQLVVADLGHLKLTNTFHLHSKRREALFEKYSIQLLDLQLYRYIHMQTQVHVRKSQ